MKVIAGVDEVGRGPLAGPVVAAAVILPDNHTIEGLADSKKLSPDKREKLSALIEHYSLAWALGRAEVGEIDDINILQASLLAMTRAVNALSVRPTLVLVDGNKLPVLSCEARAIVKGDSKIEQISAASIVAKVARDKEMASLDIQFPGYGFAKHKGYPTKDHIQALRTLGVSEIHRRSFKPVKNMLETEFI